MEIATLGHAGIRAEQHKDRTIYVLRSTHNLGEYLTPEAAAHALVWRFVLDGMPTRDSARKLPEKRGLIGSVNGVQIHVRTADDDKTPIILTANIAGKEHEVGWCRDDDAIRIVAEGIQRYKREGIPPVTHPKLAALVVGMTWTARVFDLGEKWVVEKDEDNAQTHTVFDNAESAFASLAQFARR